MFSNNTIYSDYFADHVLLLIGSNSTDLSLISFVYYLLNRVTSPTNAYNIAFIFIWILVGISAYFLFKNITGKKHLILILAIIIILISPIRLRYAFEWQRYQNWAFVLIYFVLLLTTITTQTKTYIKYALAGILFGLLLNEITYYAVMLFFISIPLLLFTTYKQNTKLINKIKYLLIYGISSLTVSIIGIYRLIFMNSGGDSIFNASVRSPEARWAYSARPWHYIIPDISHPLLGNVSVKIQYWIWNSKPYYLTEPFFPKEHSLYLGLTLILLSIYTIYLAYIKANTINRNLDTIKPQTKSKWENFKFKTNKYNDTHGVLNQKQTDIVTFFLIIAITAFIFSMPPYVNIKGLKIYFPSHFIYQFLPQFRAYARFGSFVFIANSAIAIVGLCHIYENIKLDKLTNNILQNIKDHKQRLHIKRNTIILAISILVIFEFLNFPPGHSISTNPTLPYNWLENKTNTAYLEFPKRRDYTDQLYTSKQNNTVLNPYLHTPQNVELIESTLWAEDFAQPESIWCKDFQDLGGKYIMFHKKDLIIKKIVQDFIDTGKVTPELKVAMAESWGFPVWGTHAQRPEKDLFREKRLSEMEELLRNDPKFTVVAEFSQEEIAASRPNKNMSSDKLDEVVIFEINQEYCDSLDSTN